MSGAPARFALGGLVVLGAGWLVLALFAPEAAPAPTATYTSSRQCGECHPQVYDEWSESQHAISWTNPFVRAENQSNNFANKDCIDCHAPRPVFETGIGKRVLPRNVRRPEGVDCIACHQLPESMGGGVAGTINDPRAPCRPTQVLDLQRPEFCAGCHDQHKTVQQWRASSWAAKKIDCLDCHMPFRNGDPAQGRDHRCWGGNRLELLQSAVELRGERGDGGWTVAVANTGTGHSFPTDERSRAADVFWRPLPTGETESAEPGPWRHLHRFRSPYRHETDIEDTLLAADDTWTGTIADPDAEGGVEVALFYKRSPYWEDPESPDPEREATLVHRLALEP